MKGLASFALVLAVGLVVVVSLTSTGGDRPRMNVHALGPEYSLDELWDAAEIVAVVVPTGKQVERWNNSTNTMWEAPKDSGILPMVYRDEEVLVITVLKGLPASLLTLRNLGGIADGVEFVYDGLYDLKTGERYLVFLETVQAPTQDGVEQAISFVAQGQGLFSAIGGGFQNALGRTLTLEELTSR